MLRSGEKRFEDRLPDTPVQRLADNCSAYTGHETWKFVRELNVGPCITAVSSPQSNGMAERFVKTMKEDHISFMPKPDVRTALKSLAAAFTYYNENHQHSALEYYSPREYRRQRASLTVRKCQGKISPDHHHSPTTISFVPFSKDHKSFCIDKS